jgi:hypothetical protein
MVGLSVVCARRCARGDHVHVCRSVCVLLFLYPLTLTLSTLRFPGGGWIQDVRLGVRRAIVEAYTDGAYWWEASLMMQRLVRS